MKMNGIWERRINSEGHKLFRKDQRRKRKCQAGGDKTKGITLCIK